MKALIGLGNPGPAYAKTRHNAGFWVVDELAKRHGISIRMKGFLSLSGVGAIGGCSVRLMKPQTYVNLSGEAVKAFVKYTKIDINDILIVLDDVNLTPGMVRVRSGGGDGGHKGARSVIEHMGTTAIARVRVGVGASPPDTDLTSYVLSPCRECEEKLVMDGVKTAADICEIWAQEGVAAAMNRFNRRFLHEQ